MTPDWPRGMHPRLGLPTRALGGSTATVVVVPRASRKLAVLEDKLHEVEPRNAHPRGHALAAQPLAGTRCSRRATERPHLHQDWTHACRICAGTALIAAADGLLPRACIGHPQCGVACRSICEGSSGKHSSMRRFGPEPTEPYRFRPTAPWHSIACSLRLVSFRFSRCHSPHHRWASAFG